MELLAEIQELGYIDNLLKAQRLKKLFKISKFQMIVPHIFVDAVVELPYLNKLAILDADAEALQRPPLQRDTMYFYCQLANVKPTLNVIKELQGNRLKVKPCIVSLQGLSYYELYYSPMEIEVCKDIIFKCDGNEVGWYNKRANILWICDVGYVKQNAVENIRKVLSAIVEFKVRGDISVLPDLTIGCDPEFEIIDEANNVMVPANAIFRDDPHGEPQEIGHDGHGATGEIRPQYASNPIALANNIKRTVKKLIFRLAHDNPDLDVHCGGGLLEELGLGGHIHFNIPLSGDTNKLKHILHDLVGVHVKDSMHEKCPRKQIGKYMHRDGDDTLRRADKFVGFEWRMLPSFILSEDICKAILCTTWCVVKEFYGQGFPKDNYPKAEAKAMLQALTLYPFYKVWIDKFIALFIDSKTYMEGKSLKKSWDIKPQTYNLKIHSDIEWVRKYFISANISLRRPVSISIVIGQKAELYVIFKYKPSSEILTYFDRFCDDHLINFHYDIDNHNRFDASVCIPFYNPKTDSIAFSHFRPLIKKLIDEINQK